MNVFRLCLTLSLVALAAPAAARGETLLRWKLATDERLTLVIQQRTDSQVAFSGKVAATAIEQTVELDWLVTAADDERMTIQQTIRGLKVKLAPADGAAIEYDSSTKARPSGPAGQLAESLQALAEAQIELVMTSRGQIDSATPINDAAKRLFAAAASKTDAAAKARAAIERLLRQSLVVLPEKAVAAGDSWTAESDLPPTATRALVQETVYRLVDQEDRDGERVWKIAMQSRLVPRSESQANNATQEPASPALSVKTHEQSGTILFSAERGRLVTAEETQKLVTERTYRDTPIVVTLKSTQTTTVKPSEAMP